jgi:H3 lysine-79-specific histone-lysine N-methyltransferase
MALEQMIEFKTRMKYYNLPYGKIALYEGDFLVDDRITAVLKRADVIFVNNYVFDSSTNMKLLERFLDLKEGARIISLKCFVSGGFQSSDKHEESYSSTKTDQLNTSFLSSIRRKPITYRNANSVESILDAQAFEYGSQSVSWTDSGGVFYVHTINRAPLREFWKKQGIN